MSKYTYWKLLDWIIGIVGLIFIILEPSAFFEPNLYEMSLYHTPYMIPQRIVGIFLTYCCLSLIYRALNKKINWVIHYSLIIIPYIALTILYIIAIKSGM